VVYAAQTFGPQHGPISHPQKIPSKYWVLKIPGWQQVIKELLQIFPMVFTKNIKLFEILAKTFERY